jgi:hypothetical protein
MDTYVASTPAVRTSRTSRIHVGFIGLALVGGLALGAVLASRAISVESTPHGAPGALAMGFAAYPPHYGLAGPSQVRPNPRTWIGYPAHSGLAGPSRVFTTAAPSGSGPGYPPHHGLAGPSRVDGGR